MIKGADVSVLAEAVEAVEGTVTHRLERLAIVGAQLTESQIQRLRGEHPEWTVFRDVGLPAVDRDDGVSAHSEEP